MVTLDEVKSYLRITYTDDDTLLNSLIGVADEYLKSSIGKTYDNTTERAKMLSLFIIGDLYDNRGISEQVSTKTRGIVDSFIMQMRLELSAVM